MKKKKNLDVHVKFATDNDLLKIKVKYNEGPLNIDMTMTKITLI